MVEQRVVSEQQIPRPEIPTKRAPIEGEVFQALKAAKVFSTELTIDQRITEMLRNTPAVGVTNKPTDLDDYLRDQRRRERYRNL